MWDQVWKEAWDALRDVELLCHASMALLACFSHARSCPLPIGHHQGTGNIPLTMAVSVPSSADVLLDQPPQRLDPPLLTRCPLLPLLFLATGHGSVRSLLS